METGETKFKMAIPVDNIHVVTKFWFVYFGLLQESFNQPIYDGMMYPIQ